MGSHGEQNEITNEKDERDCEPVARQPAPMISKFIRSQWESPELEYMDDERRQILEDAAELDHIFSIQFSTYGVHGSRRRSRPTILTSGLSKSTIGSDDTHAQDASLEVAWERETNE